MENKNRKHNLKHLKTGRKTSTHMSLHTIRRPITNTALYTIPRTVLYSFFNASIRCKSKLVLKNSLSVKSPWEHLLPMHSCLVACLGNWSLF